MPPACPSVQTGCGCSRELWLLSLSTCSLFWHDFCLPPRAILTQLPNKLGSSNRSARVKLHFVLCIALSAAVLLEGHDIGYAAAADSPSASVRQGIAKYYSPGVFRDVATNRGMRMLNDVDGYAAVLSCSRIGQVVKASINNGPVERYQVLDCSAPWDRATHIAQGLVIEVDYQSALRNNFVGSGHAEATVYFP